MTRMNLFLFTAALLQALVLVLLVRPFAATESAAAGSRALFAFETREARMLKLVGEGGQETFSFRRAGPDAPWTFVEKDGFPAEAGKIGGGETEGLLEKIAAIEVSSPIAATAAGQEVLSLSDQNYERRVVIEGEDGKTLADFYVSRGSRGGRVQLRRNGEMEVYESDDLAFWDLGLSVTEFIGRELVKLDQGAVTAVRIRRPDAAPIELVRDIEGEGETRKAGDWRLVAPEAGAADQDKVKDLVEHLADIRIDDVLGREAPAGVDPERPLASFELDLPGGTETFVLEEKREDGDYVLLWRNPGGSPRSGYHVVALSWSLGEAATIDLEALKAKPPESRPADETEPEDGR